LEEELRGGGHEHQTPRAAGEGQENNMGDHADETKAEIRAVIFDLDVSVQRLARDELELPLTHGLSNTRARSWTPKA